MKYALSILQNTGHTRAGLEKLHIEQNLKLSLTEEENLNDPSKYRRLSDRLVYLTVTRPDIVYSVRMLGQFMHQPAKKTTLGGSSSSSEIHQTYS